MKRSLFSFLAALFILSTLFSSLHELMPNHNSSDCQVCTFNGHDNGLAPETIEDVVWVQPTFRVPLALQSLTISIRISLDNPRAPPSFS